MNREQRRAAERQPPMKIRQLSFYYGHNGQYVVVSFTYKIDNFTLTEQQTDEMINALQIAKKTLINHKAVAAREGGHGNA